MTVNEGHMNVGVADEEAQPVKKKKIVSPIFPLWSEDGHRANLSSRHDTPKPSKVRKLEVPSILNNTELNHYFAKRDRDTESS